MMMSHYGQSAVLRTEWWTFAAKTQQSYLAQECAAAAADAKLVIVRPLLAASQARVVPWFWARDQLKSIRK